MGVLDGLLGGVADLGGGRFDIVGGVLDGLQEETSNPGWQFVGFHDLRRTWATQLRSADVDAMVVWDCGRWDDLETVPDHYQGTHTPEAQRKAGNSRLALSSETY